MDSPAIQSQRSEQQREKRASVSRAVLKQQTKISAWSEI